MSDEKSVQSAFAAFLETVDIADERAVSAAQRLTSSKSCEHYTDPEVVEAVRYTLGRIDVDPFSCEEANQVVKAETIITAKNDGFIRPWNELGAPNGPKRAFVNPPSTEPGDVKRAWLKAMSERRAGHIEAVVFVVFRIDALQSMMLGAWKNGYPGPQSAWRCEPRKRLQYWQPGGRELLDGRREGSTAAMHGSCILLHTEDDSIESRFREAFEKFGPVFHPSISADHVLTANAVRLPKRAIVVPR